MLWVSKLIDKERMILQVFIYKEHYSQQVVRAIRHLLKPSSSSPLRPRLEPTFHDLMHPDERGLALYMEARKDPLPRARCLRQRMEALTNLIRLDRSKCAFENVTTPFEGEWVSPVGSKSEKVVLYLHGGGYVAGHPRHYRGFAGILALQGQCRVFSLAYRLAPEHIWPASLVDAVECFKWLINDLKINPKQIVLMGDSAGGNLALNLLVTLREEGLPMPAGAALFSPWVELGNKNDSYYKVGHQDCLLDPRFMDYISKVIMGGKIPSAANTPIMRSIHGLCPLLIIAGTEEILLDDTLNLTARAQLADVPVETKIYEGMFHSFVVFAGLIPEANHALDGVCANMRKWCSVGTS